MELPKLVYDDFYKFLMSLGTILLLMSGVGIFIYSNKTIWWGLITGLVIIFIIGCCIMVCAGRKWYKNQKNIDEKIAAETKLISYEASQIVSPEVVDSGHTLAQAGVALVSYRLASELPNSVSFNFQKDFRVWFWITNQEPRKYLVYVKVKFISDGFIKEELNSDYYSGIKAWKLDAYSGIQAPGLDFPDEIRTAVKEGRRIKVEINCEVHDESNRLIERKFPQTYVYDPESNSWFLEP